MPDFFFNELSIHDQFQHGDEFRTALKQFVSLRSIVLSEGHPYYVHRGISQRRALGLSFCDAVRSLGDKNITRQIMLYINKAGIFLPDAQTFLHTDSFHLDDENIENTALAECAYRMLLGEHSICTSIERSRHSHSPLRVEVMCGNSSSPVSIKNYYEENTLKNAVHALRPPLQTWEEMLARSRQLSHIIIFDYVDDQLLQEPFHCGLAEETFRRLEALSQMSSAPDRKSFVELYSKYCTGGKAWFSDSSATEKNNFKEALTFDINNKRQLCPYHGKVKIRQFRIHMASIPSLGEDNILVYVGPKITR